MKLDIGEVLCPHCESGKIIDIEFNYCGTKTCTFCKGKGKLDWIENIVGVKFNQPKTTPINNIRFSDLMKDYEKTIISIA